MAEVPTIDLRAARSDPDMLAALDAACRDHGFFLLRGHGIDREIEAMWQAATDFFAQPATIKRQLLRTEASPLGYFDRELTKRKRDQKEVFDYMMPRPDGSDRNQWPDDPAFVGAMTDFFHAASDVAAQTLALVLEPLRVRTGVSLPGGAARTSTVRLNHYPVDDPLEDGIRETVNPLGDMALHHHTDPGVLTLLLQDMTGGLQARSRDDGWIDVVPEAGTIVVNLGDAMQVWTNDAYVAAVHRVLPRTNVSRYSTPYFYNPAADAILAPIDGLTTAPPRYRSFTWKEYIRGRVDDNFTDLGDDDIQIAQYRVA